MLQYVPCVSEKRPFREIWGFHDGEDLSRDPEDLDLYIPFNFEWTYFSH
jgi:hypothetical protein